MKTKLFLIVLLLAAISTIGISQDKQSAPATTYEGIMAERERIAKLPIDIKSLVTLKGVNVFVVPLKEDARSAGLTEEQLKTDVESKLRLAGIKVNSREEMLATKDQVYIYVNVNTVSYKDSPGIAYSYFVGFKQQAMLVRSPFTTVAGVTWEVRLLGMCPKTKFPDITRQRIKDCAAKFIKDYFTANPK